MQERRQISICVLPFGNMSGDPAQDYFSTGITQDVVTDLSKVSMLEVVGRPENFAGGSIDPKQLARQLGVTHLLEGSVRKAGERLRVTAQLLDASSGKHLWAERYDRDLSDIFEIQDEISQAIVSALQLTLLPAERSAIEDRSTANADAYDLYLKARQAWATANIGDYRVTNAIIALCGEATAADPGYALAHALAALAKAELHFWHGESAGAAASAERAKALNPALPEPYCVLARDSEEHGQQGQARSLIEKALDAGPDSWDASREAARFLFGNGEFADAIRLFDKAVSLNHMDHESASMLVVCFKAEGDSDRMRDAAEVGFNRAELIIVCDPINGSAFASAGRALAALDEADRAKRWLRKALNLDPGNLFVRYSVAVTRAALLGDDAGAIEALEPFAERAALPQHLAMLECDPAWDRLRDTPEFVRITKQMRTRLGA
jgi:adenylate cyclase